MNNLWKHFCQRDSRSDHRPLSNGRIVRWFCFLTSLGIPQLALQAQTNFNISAGATVSTINSTLSTAAATSGNVTVNFAAGNYSINSLVTVPCPSGTSLTIKGPTVAYAPPVSVVPSSYSYTSPYTANLNGSLASGFGWQVGSSGCNNPIIIEYFNWNGGQPSGGGGGWLNVVGGTSNLRVQYNYVHGNWASTSTGHSYDELISLSGVGQSNAPVDTNVSITWNVFGNGSSDCNPIMNLYTYQGGGFNSAGGYCNGVGISVSTTNLVIQNNDFEHLEQGLKFFEGAAGPNDPTHQYILNNALVTQNDFAQIHRIPMEAQQYVGVNSTTGGVFNATNNSVHDLIFPAFGTFGFSLPMCCGGYQSLSNDNQVNCTSNAMVGNVPTDAGLGGSGAAQGEAFEWWSTGSCSNNLVQGYFGAAGAGASSPNNACSVPNCGGQGVAYGYTSSVRTWVASNNICQFHWGTNSGCVSTAGYGSTPPTQTGNTTSTSVSAVNSHAPSISPSSGSFSGSVTVTLTDTGDQSGLGPQGNTSIYYTTDGSTPVPHSGTTQLYTGSFLITATTTVNAVGMWGAANQPASYPSGYGYVPSSAVSATYTASGGTVVVGNNTANFAGTTYENAFNDVYSVTGSNPPGYAVKSGTVCIAPGPVTLNKHTDIGVNTAPTSTTEGTTALCHGTYTNTGDTSPGCVTVPLTGCGLLSASAPYWVWTITDDPLAPSPLDFSNCGGSCNGGVPTAGVGTYGGFYLSGTYGSYAAMSSTFTGGPATSGQPTVYLNVVPAVTYGNTVDNFAGTTYQNAFNDVYAVTGSDPAGYTVNSGTVCIAPGTVSQGKHTDIGINTAPTATTEGATALCHATYTNATTHSPGCVTVPLTGCGTLSPNAAYWIWTITDDTLAPSPLDFSNCGGSCNGGAPTSGVGTYGGFYLSGTYGTYTGMSSAFTGGPSTGGQPSVSLTLTPQ